MAKKQQDVETTSEVAESRESNRQQKPAPECPYCSKPGAPVVCVSRHSDPYFTFYYCPNDRCSFSQKQPRPALLRTMLKKSAEEDYSAR